jgi:hypothetical protein
VLFKHVLKKGGKMPVKDLFYDPSDELNFSFLNRLSKKPVITNRYLWHLKYNVHQSDLSVAANGLICSENYAVFAHNCLNDFELLYPYLYDQNRFNMSLEDYSFWRIDTHLLDNNEWFVDPNMKVELRFRNYRAKPINYLCTLNNIPNTALKLFNFNRNRYESKNVFVNINEGVANVYPYRNDYDSLVPNHEINKYIEWRIKNIQT